MLLHSSLFTDCANTNDFYSSFLFRVLKKMKHNITPLRTQGPCGEIKATFYSNGPGAGTKTAPPPPLPARNADRDIQLPDGRIATRPLCCSPPSLPARTRTQTHTSTCAGPHMSAHKPVHPPSTRPSTCSQTHVSSPRPMADAEGDRVKLGFNVNTLLSPCCFVYRRCPAPLGYSGTPD